MRRLKLVLVLAAVLVPLYLTQGTRERAAAGRASTAPASASSSGPSSAPSNGRSRAPSSAPANALASADAAIAAAFREQRSDLQVRGSGVVDRVLADDNDGSRHQRFVLRLSSGQTVLVAHNIDLAPRLADLARGDTVAFNGEYEWNANGGVIHWTHHDPAGRHEGGWLERRGKRVQ